MSDWLLLHGSTGAGLLRACARGASISVAITHIDGLVVARSAFDHSMNYRSVVAFGVPEVLTGAEKARALARLTDHLLPGRVGEIRDSTTKELAATTVLRLRLDEVSVKVRSAGATTDPDDGEDRGVWAGCCHSACGPQTRCKPPTWVTQCRCPARSERPPAGCTRRRKPSRPWPDSTPTRRLRGLYVALSVDHAGHPSGAPMALLRVHNLSVSLDGYAAGPDQSVDHPLGVGGEALHTWLFATRTLRQLFGEEAGHRVSTTPSC